MANKRYNGEIKELTFSFVVQRANYKELKQFVHMCLEWNADKIVLLRMADWGLYSEQEMMQMSMYDKDGRANHELVDILNDPIFENDKVDMGNLL